jgi:Mg2+-importing ATPase
MKNPTTSNGAPVALAEFARLPASAVLDQLGVTRSGLSETSVQERTEQYGPNKVAHEAPPTWYFQLAHAFWNPFIGVLLALGALSYITGDIGAVVVISTLVTISALLVFFQEFRSNQAALALQAMVTTRATVERVNDVTEDEPSPSPTKRELPIEQIVPGDIVHVSAGDMLPADVRFLSSKDLFISQSALTGEAIPVEKSDAAMDDGAAIGTSAHSLTDLRNVGFMGTSVVSGTASAVVLATGGRTYFGSMAKGLVGQRPPTSFDLGVNKVSWLLIRFMVVMVPIVFVINGLSKHNWVEAFMFGLAVAVGLTPEMLPMIVTANLAKGAVTMARHKTIVKRLNAIQNFGAMDVLCTDKTGTLTQDKIVLEKHINVIGEEDEEVLNLAYLNSVYQTGLKNLLDVAILEKSELNASLGIDTVYKKVDEIPFDFVRRRMSVVVERGKEVHELICKGAVEEILGVSTYIRDEDRIIPLDDETRETALEVVQELNEDGLRVIAIAYREFPPRTGAFTVADEGELILAGFMAFLDPPKDSAAPALRALKQAGVAVKILTGDNATVTRKVCRDVGLEVGVIVNGSDLDSLSDAELSDLAEKTTVFAKLAPLQKTRVVQALRARGHTVGFLGDGINDAGALREADLGISVDSAVDIAKESADIILLEKSLMVLEEGVLEGRKIFGNIIKYIKMTASSNYGNVFSVLVASSFLPFLPMLPIQLLVLNLLYNISQTTIPFDDMDADYLLVPRKWSADDIGRFMLIIGPTSSVFDMATFAVMWWIFKANSPANQSLFQSGWFIESLISQTLVVHLIRTAKIPFIQSRATWPVLTLTTIIMIIGMILPFSPLGVHMGLEALPGIYFLWLALIVTAYIALTQFVKVWYIKRFNAWL